MNVEPAVAVFFFTAFFGVGFAGEWVLRRRLLRARAAWAALGQPDFPVVSAQFGPVAFTQSTWVGAKGRVMYDQCYRVDVSRRDAWLRTSVVRLPFTRGYTSNLEGPMVERAVPAARRAGLSIEVKDGELIAHADGPALPDEARARAALVHAVAMAA